MNVLFVIKGNEPYIAQQAQIELAAGLQKKGVNILLSGNFSKEVASHLDRLSLPYLYVFPKKSIDREYTEAFRKLLDEYQIDLVHFVDGKSARNGLRAIKDTHVKSVIYFGSASLHWYDPTSYFTYLSPHLDAIIGNSDYVYNHVKSQLFGKNKEKAVRIFKGYNPEWFETIEPKDLSKFGIQKDDLVVCLVGNHRKVKGTRYYLEATYHVKTEKSVHFLLIGDRTDDDTFQKLRASSPFEKQIHLLGRRNDVVSILKSCDIYVQTSLEEGFGRAISEAMSVGNPVVMTNAGGCTELIDDTSGIVVPLKDSEAIGAAISTLLNDDSLRIDMGENARKRIETVFHINDTIQDTLHLYQRLLHS
jgi:glycosyltransferase involved in cell wall biosynthesis